VAVGERARLGPVDSSGPPTRSTAVRSSAVGSVLTPLGHLTARESRHSGENEPPAHSEISQVNVPTLFRAAQVVPVGDRIPHSKIGGLSRCRPCLSAAG
jgi:hypothetical protein